MKYITIITILFLMACQDNVSDKPIEQIPIDTIEQIITEADIEEMLPEIRKEIEATEILSITPKDKFRVVVGFEGFKEGDEFVVTTREGKKGYPYYEGLFNGVPHGQGYPHYWIEYKGNIQPIADTMLLKRCAALKK